jgi:hypothetical protein
MKILYALLLGAGLCIAGCKKENIPAYGNEIIIPPPQDTQTVVLYTGTLIGGEFGDK